jgi:Virulence activator alpha C-term
LKQWIVAPTEPPRAQYDLLVKLLGSHVADQAAFQAELDRIRSRAEKWMSELRALHKECLRGRATWSEHDQILYLTLRRGLLLGQAQLRWLREASEFISSGKLTA